MTYERLLKLAKKMHLWIFLHCYDEGAVYEELGLTEEEDAFLGYGGSFTVETNESEGADDENNG